MLCNASSEAPCLRLCGSPVLICAAHVDAIVAAGFAVARIAIRAEHAANDVPEVGHIVNIGQSAGDQDVPGTYTEKLQVAVSLLPTR